MLKIRMGLEDTGRYNFKTKKTNILLDCSMEEFEDKFYEMFTKKGYKTGGIMRSQASKVFKIFKENSNAFDIEVKEVNKISLDTTMDMIKKKVGGC